MPLPLQEEKKSPPTESPVLKRNTAPSILPWRGKAPGMRLDMGELGFPHGLSHSGVQQTPAAGLYCTAGKNTPQMLSLSEKLSSPSAVRIYLPECLAASSVPCGNPGPAACGWHVSWAQGLGTVQTKTSWERLFLSLSPPVWSLSSQGIKGHLPCSCIFCLPCTTKSLSFLWLNYVDVLPWFRLQMNFCSFWRNKGLFCASSSLSNSVRETAEEPRLNLLFKQTGFMEMVL